LATLVVVFVCPSRQNVGDLNFLAAARSGCNRKVESQTTIGNNQLPIQSITRKPKAENIYAF